MKLSDAWRLGAANLRTHKARSLAAVITVSLMFGVILGINFLLTGIQQSLLPYAQEATDGKIYIVSYMRGQTGERVMRARQEKYHGKVVGELLDVEAEPYRHIYYMPENVLQPWIGMNLDTLMPGAVPVMLTQSAREHRAEGIGYGEFADLPAEMVEVGTLPEGSTGKALRIGQPPSFHPLNYVLSTISRSHLIPYAIVQREGAEPPAEAVQREIVEFTDVREAYNYLEMEDEAEFNYNNQQAQVWEIFSEQAQIYRGVRWVKDKVMILEIVFAVLAAVIMVLTFAHLLDQDAQMIALYRSMGATTRDVVKITTCYLVQMSLLAIGLATLIGLMLAGGISLAGAGDLRVAAEAHYGVTLKQGMALIGFDAGEYFTVVGVIVAMVPLALLLTADRLSGKHLAARLKR